MTKNRILQAGLLALGLIGLGMAQERPNVILLLSDDLGWKDLGCYDGPVRTPALDRLAGSGARFTDFHAGAAVCSPSRATLLTGRHHVRTGVYSWIDDRDQQSHLLESEVTLAEVLKQQGYATAHVGKWHLGAPFRGRDKPWIDAHGFDTWFATDNNAAPSHRDPVNFWRNRKRVGPLKGYACDLVVDEAIRWMEGQGETPFFLNIWFHEPHAPIAAPDHIVTEYGGLKDDGAIYSGTVDNTDRAVERLLEKLKAMGLEENTLVIYSSDNGSYRRDRVGELRESKGSNFEGGIRVPGIFSWPGRIPGRRVLDEPAGLIDVLPTVCGLLEIAPPQGVKLDGTDLSALLLGKSESISRAQPFAWFLPLSSSPVALRDGRWSLVGRRAKEFPRDRAAMAGLIQEMKKVLREQGDPDPEATIKAKLYEGFGIPEADRLRGEYVRHNQFQESWIPAIKNMKYDRFELFDLSRDIGQQHNLAAEHPKVFTRLKRQLLGLVEDVVAEGPAWGAEAKPAKEWPANPGAVKALIKSSCLECHDRDTKTPLNLEALALDLQDPKAYRAWEAVFDQVTENTMPPAKKPRPDPAQKTAALAWLQGALHRASRAEQQQHGRVPVRRLTRQEFEYSLQDLLGTRGELARFLPPESASGRFDTVAEGQGMSPVHVRSTLEAADVALDEAIELGPRPRSMDHPHGLDYRNSTYTKMWLDRPLRRGGNTVIKTEDAFVLFEGRPHITRSDHMGWNFPVPGRYRVDCEAYAYQAKTPVTLCLYRSSDLAGKAELVAAWQLDPGKPRRLSVEHDFQPGDFLYLAPADLDWDAAGKNVLMVGAHGYSGEGVAIRGLNVEGPIEAQWPPPRTRQLLGEVTFKLGQGGFRVELKRPPLEQIEGIVARLAPRAFRRPVTTEEVDSWTAMARPVLERDGNFLSALRVVLRAMFSSSDFLYASEPPGPLGEHAVAARLARFLWRSIPDAELVRVAGQGRLRVAEQAARLLDDPRAMRFIDDFLGQWLDLHAIDATTPDRKLYPEYDDVLRQAMLEETRQFFAELIRRDLGVRELIDADFTFLNRRLATHYDVQGVQGLAMRKVRLPAASPRGGLLSQASVLKTTANGTTTSPVLRGSFVLGRLLGQEPKPPPPDAGTIEPDTRGTTTIRETLDAHRNVERCARCHREIDPPGFALESFDAIGGFRTRYRSTDKGVRSPDRLFGRRIHEYRLGPVVDASGMTATGRSFSGFEEFKTMLLEREEAIARNLIEQLIVFATGAEIQFADREVIDRLMEDARANDFGIRGMILGVVQSRLFLEK